MSFINSIKNIIKFDKYNFIRIPYINSRQLCTSSDIPIDFVKKRREPVVVIPLESSVKYMNSNAYKLTYGESPVWVQYRRNHKGQIPPRKTRKTCVRKGLISTGNPCPICRDEYLVLHETNVKLLKQFVSEHTGQILSYRKTGLCQKKHKELEISILRSYDQGLLTYDVPFREYDYLEYLPKSEIK